MSQNQTADVMSENFADLLAESFAEDTSIEGSVVKGIVVGVSDDHVTIDVGLKSEGRLIQCIVWTSDGIFWASQ